jgi:hypothetical protein
MSLSLEDRKTLQQVGELIMGLQKDEAREAPVRPAKLVQLLEDMYGMEVVSPAPNELEAFRHQTRDVYGPPRGRSVRHRRRGADQAPLL